MPIRGQYHTQLHNISIDLPSSLFQEGSSVVKHEVTHYYLSNYTNEGAVFSILSEIFLHPNKLVVEGKYIKKAHNVLHRDMYDVQEGIAHLMQAFEIYDSGGDGVLKKWEDGLPNEAKAAFGYVKYVLKLSKEQRDLFIPKVSDISLNNDLYKEVIQSPQVLITDGLEMYLKNNNNSAKRRYEIICLAIEKDKSLLNLDQEDICKRLSIPYNPLISNKEKADLINSITSFTDSPTTVKESDIVSLKSVEDALYPAFESVIIVDANLAIEARIGLNQEEILSESNYFRTLFVYNNPESPQAENHFGFYSFSRRRYIINGSLERNERSLGLFEKNITRVVDTASFDFNANRMKSERIFVDPHIIWHKNYPDLVPFLDMAERMDLVIEKNSFAFTESHSYRFFILRERGSSVLHITAGYPFIEKKIQESNFNSVTQDFFEIIKGKEQHINNFFHDLLGIPYLIDLVRMAKDAEGFLEIARVVKDHGMPVNELCICGSRKKYKKCHGR